MLTKFKKNKKEGNISFRNIKKFDEIIDYLKSINRYFSKPYTVKEIIAILKREQTVSVYFAYNDKNYVIDHIVINSALLKINRYYLNTVEYAKLEDIFTDPNPFGCALKDDWANVQIKIMLGDEDQQVL